MRQENKEKRRNKFPVWMESQVGEAIQDSVDHLELVSRIEKREELKPISEQIGPTAKDEVANRIAENERQI